MEQEYSVSDKYVADWNFTCKHTSVLMLFESDADIREKADEHSKHITDRITSAALCPQSTGNMNNTRFSVSGYFNQVYTSASVISNL